MIWILGIILLAILLIALAVIFWYISIPIIILIAIYYKRDKIRNYLQSKRAEKARKQYARSSPSDTGDYERIRNLIQSLRISDSETEQMLGRDWESLTSLYALHERMNMIGSDKNRLLDMPRDLILKFSTLYESVYKIDDTGSFSENGEFSEIQNNCKNCYENYSKSKYEKSQGSSYNTNDSNNRYRKNTQNTHNTGSKRNSRSSYRQARVRRRLEQFNITEQEAEKIFGKRWNYKLGKLDFELYYEIKRIQLKITYQNQAYLRKIGYLYDKVLDIINIVIEDNQDLEEQNQEGYEDYESEQYESYEQDQSNEQYEEESSYEEYTGTNDSDILSKSYKTLGLEPSCSVQQIKTRFRELIKQFHPDKNKSPEANSKTREILEAYENIMIARGATSG